VPCGEWPRPLTRLGCLEPIRLSTKEQKYPILNGLYSEYYAYLYSEDFHLVMVFVCILNWGSHKD